MRVESAQGLKQQLLREVVEPFVDASVRRSRRAQPASPVPDGAEKSGMVVPPVTFAVGARPFETLPKIPRSIALGVAPSRANTGSPSASSVPACSKAR